MSGIGNAYSDEILHAAKLSPITLTHKLQPEEWKRLFAATVEVMRLWVGRLQAEADVAFPEKVTAFRKDMAVHGRYGEPCPDAERKFSASGTQTTKQIIVPNAKPEERYWRTGAYPGS